MSATISWASNSASERTDFRLTVQLVRRVGGMEMISNSTSARNMKLPPSRVYGVATFYHFFSLKPAGEHTCVVCTGTACYVKGADDLVHAVEDLAHIKLGETTEDGKLSLLSARCLGACGLAPAVVFDEAVAGQQTADSALNRVKEWLDHGTR